MRQLIVGDKAVPLAHAARSVRRNVSHAVPAHRKPSRGVIADVPVDVGVDKILGRPGETRQSGVELIPVSGAVHIEEGKIERAFLGRHPAHGVILVALGQKNRTVPSDPRRQFHRTLALYLDNVALQARLLTCPWNKYRPVRISIRSGYRS